MIPPYLYSTVFLYSVIILTLIAFTTVQKSYDRIRYGSNNFIPTLFICAVYALWIGFRPISGYYFGDTSNYALSFQLMREGLIVPAEDGEWVWNNLMYLCSQTMDISAFFTLVDIGYFGFTLWACKRLTPNNVLLSMLFCMGALSFFTYATNGIRNGLACSLILLYLSFLSGNKKDKIIAAAIAFVAFNIHHTTALPVLMSVISLFFMRSFKWAYTFWILSILVSLVAGGAVTSFFAGFGFDDRLSYLTTMDDGMFSHTGFRWDFLIYSMMPIVLGYYVIYKRGIRNTKYEVLLNTYTLSNAFWVMVISANYSNRFAYLSWFMYPIVLAYPLLKLDIWDNLQGKRLKQIMFAHVGFTWFMSTFYW